MASKRPLVNYSGQTQEIATGDVVPVTNGGTGVTTITGVVVGNGTGALSAAVSGTDIKTINGTSVIGSGNITVSSGITKTDPDFMRMQRRMRDI